MLIMQPTAFCNIDCSYCYLPMRNTRNKMSFEVVESAFSKVFSSSMLSNHLSVVWHAGEPLTVPVTWYEEAIRKCETHRPIDVQVQHVFQTNGTLINSSWIEFFSNSGVKVSLSIDGPSWIHDKRRLDRNGSGTHARSMRGLEMLQKARLNPPVLSVLTLEGMQYPDDFFDFYKDAGITDVAFNIEEVEGANKSTSLASPNVVKEYKRFLNRFLYRMYREPDVLKMRELTNVTDVIRFGYVPFGSNQEAEPLRIISVTVDGSVSTFSPEFIGIKDETYGDFIFGNILKDEIHEVFRRVLTSRLHRNIQEGISACRTSCAWFDWCGGGTPSNKYFENGSPSSTRTLFCSLTRIATFDVVIDNILKYGGAPDGRCF